MAWACRRQTIAGAVGHNMEKTTKIFLSIPPIIGILYMLTYMYPTEFNWLIPDMTVYYGLTTIINLSILTTVIILIRRLWNFKNTDSSKKSTWTWLMILFNAVTALIYIWKIDDQMTRENKNTVPNKG